MAVSLHGVGFWMAPTTRLAVPAADATFRYEGDLLPPLPACKLCVVVLRGLVSFCYL